MNSYYPFKIDIAMMLQYFNILIDNYAPINNIIPPPHPPQQATTPSVASAHNTFKPTYIQDCDR